LSVYRSYAFFKRFLVYDATYPGCDLIDFVAPTIITKGDQTIYSCVLVSIKSRMYFSPGEAGTLCDDIMAKADKCGLENALCIVCVFG
jgi:hypothetical protein